MATELLFDVKEDIWVLPAEGNISDYAFYFDFYPNQTIKDQVKRYALDNIDSRRVKVATLHRYSYALRHFFNFLLQEGIQLESFAGVSHQMVEAFVMHLLGSMDKPTTRSLAIAALKAVITHGQRFEYEGYPRQNIFDGDEFRRLQTEDQLITRYIPDSVMEQINLALDKDRTELILNRLLIVLRDTGIRLGEALALNTNSLLDDFLGKPILHVVSQKSENERFIPVSSAVKEALLEQIKICTPIREETGDERIFLYKYSDARDSWRLDQRTARYLLSAFVSRNGIRDSSGELYQLTFHAFRHTLGMKMLNSGLTHLEVQEYLGHESSHSTAHYAKVVNKQVSSEMRKAGLIGQVVRELSTETIGENALLDAETLKSAALPDGACSKPINSEGKVCKRFNMCIFCPKFITTPQFLDVHKGHLRRLQQNNATYMQENYIGTEHHLTEVEEVLVEIIERLEEIQNG